MATHHHHAGFERSASGIYARQMEAALTIKPCRVQKRICADVQRIALGGCTLYRIAWNPRSAEQVQA